MSVMADLESATKPRTPSILRQNIAKLEFLKITFLYICFPVLVTFTYFLLGFNLISDFKDATISDTTNGTRYHAMNATDGVSYHALDEASYNATSASNYHIMDGADYNATGGTSYNATDDTSYYAMGDTICEVMPSTAHDTSVLCGIAVFISNWLPAFLYKVYLGTNVRPKGLLLFLFVALFPIIPTMLYVHLLCQRKYTKEDREKYKILKKTAHKLRSTAEAIQSSTLLIIVIYLMHQGILATPWNDPIVSFQDNYRNIAYRPSLSVASIAFPTICIFRTLIYLNRTSQSTSSKNQLNENAETNQVLILKGESC